MERGENKPCAFLHTSRELLVLLYVDDCLEDGVEEDVAWMSDQLDDRLKCQDTEWLPGHADISGSSMYILIHGEVH